MIKLPVILLPPTLKVDRSATLKMATRELSNEEVNFIRDHQSTEGWMIYAPNEVKEDEIPTIQAEVGSKTPSQRLRAVLYILYKQEGPKEDFEVYYRDRMEKIIDHIKNKLDI